MNTHVHVIDPRQGVDCYQLECFSCGHNIQYMQTFVDILATVATLESCDVLLCVYYGAVQIPVKLIMLYLEVCGYSSGSLF